jgi:hypothetical protein
MGTLKGGLESLGSQICIVKSFQVGQAVKLGPTLPATVYRRIDH